MRKIITPAAALVTGLAACLAATATVHAETAELNGAVRSGDMPIPFASVTLYRAGDRPGAGQVVLGSDLADHAGAFTIEYEAPADADAILYIVADGPVDSIRLATVLGSDPDPEVTVNERTTVATAFAMAQFIVDDAIGGSSPGLQNAAGTSHNLADPASGGVAAMLALSPNGPDTTSMRLFNSLANILAGCVRGHIDCDVLFAIASPPDGPNPTDTLGAAINIAHYSWQNPVELFELSGPEPADDDDDGDDDGGDDDDGDDDDGDDDDGDDDDGDDDDGDDDDGGDDNDDRPYQPSLTSAPVTWAVALKYIGNGAEFDGPGAVAFDEHGNAWVNQNYVFMEDHTLPTCDAKILSKLTPTGDDFPGAPYSGGGLSGAGFGITLDPSGDVWIGNFGFFGSTCPCDDIPLANSVSLFSSDGTPVSGPDGYTQGCVTAVQAIVSDLDGNIWMADMCGGTVTQYKGGDPDDFWIYDIAAESLRDPADPCLEFSGLGPKPFAIAIDNDGNAWVTNNAGANADATAFKLSPDGCLLATVTAEQGIDRPMGVAIDPLGNVWVNNSAIVSLPCAGCDMVQDYGPLTPSDEAPPSVLQLDADGNPIGELTGGGLVIPWGNAVDGDGNVWVANFGGQRVSHFDGATGEAVAPHGYHSNALMRNTGVSIDPSGNVWLANNWLNDVTLVNPGGDGVVVFVGLAAPVVTPLIGPSVASEPEPEPAIASCPADLNLDRVVGSPDLFNVIVAWGSSNPSGDANTDDHVDMMDVLAVIMNWGPCD